jgi:hypothetical protein
MWRVHAKLKADPNLTLTYLAEEKPSKEQIRQWRMIQSVDDDNKWEIVVVEEEDETV